MRPVPHLRWDDALARALGDDPPTPQRRKTDPQPVVKIEKPKWWGGKKK